MGVLILAQYYAFILIMNIEDKLVGNTHYFVLGLLIEGKLLPGITGSGPNKALAEYEAVDKAYQFLEKIDWDLTSIR